MLTYAPQGLGENHNCKGMKEGIERDLGSVRGRKNRLGRDKVLG